MKKSRELPVVNVRDLVIFEKMKIPLYIGRKFTVDSILKAKEYYDGKLFVFSQRAAEKNDRLKKSDIHPIGTECRILESVHYPDGTMKVQLESTKVFKLEKLSIKDGVRFASARPVVRKGQVRLNSKKKIDLLKLVVRWNPEIAMDDSFEKLQSLSKSKGHGEFITSILHTACTRSATWVKDKGGRTRTKENKKALIAINRGVLKRQKILAEPDVGKQISLLKELLVKESMQDLKTLSSS